MTKITLDPEELNTTATTLEQCSVELADIGSQLTGCVACPMPPEVDQVVGTLVATVDAILDRLGAVLHTEAVGLARRAVLAAIDSLAAATGSTRELVAAQAGVDLVAIGSTGPVVDTTVLAGAGLVTSTVVGGSMSSGLTILPASGPTSSSSTEALGLTVVGGSWSPGGADITITPGPPSGTSRVTTSMGMDPAVQIASGFTNHQASENIRYDTYATNMNQAGREPVERHQWPG